MAKKPAIPFRPTDLQRAAALDDVVYEMEQLAGTCLHFVNHGTGPEVETPETEHDVLTANVYLESLLLHVRVLLDFFERSTRGTRSGKELDDVLSQDYGFPAQRIDIDTSLRQRLNKDVAHLSYSRMTRQGAARNWNLDVMAAPVLRRSDRFAQHALSAMALSSETRERFTVVRRLIARLLSPLDSGGSQ